MTKRVTRSAARILELACDLSHDSSECEGKDSNQEVDYASDSTYHFTKDDILRKKRAETSGILVVKQEAFAELLNIRAANGGASTYGDIPFVTKKYNKLGYNYVTIGVLKYMISKHRRKRNWTHPIPSAVQFSSRKPR
jgi:hypothetical protein